MLNEDVLNALPEAIYQRLNKINTAYLQLIGQKVKEIGEMSPEDLRKLQRIQTYNGDIERELEHAIDKSASEVYEMIDAVAKDMYTDAKPAYDEKGIKYIPYAKNKELRRYVGSISRQTAGELVNITQHTAFCVWGKKGETVNTFFAENRNKIPTSLSETYTRVIDEAVTAAQMGLTDYNTAMRKTLRTISDSGIRTVDYATGYSRRLDTAVRQNVLWGIKQCCVGAAEQLGEDIGADGWEISYHSNPRPSHEEMGGQQYAAGDKGVTIDGKYYPPFSDVADLLQDFNCLHYKMPILLGISEPAYDDDELAEMKEHDRRTFEYEGKEYTGYEASQIQRKLETEIRRQKDRANLFAASGDDDGRRAAQEKINLLTKKYKEFSDAAGLPYKTERMSVAKFHRVKTTVELKRTPNRAPSLPASSKVKKTPKQKYTVTETEHFFTGTNFKRNATVYTLEDGTRFIFPNDINHQLQTMTPEQAMSLWEKVPRELRQKGQKTIEFVDYYNPKDSYWQRVYKNFTQSYATGGKNITFYRWEKTHDAKYVVRTYCHEIGHFCDNVFGSSPGGKFSSEKLWTNAINDDKIVTGRDSCTGYGSNSPAEDFAESIAEYVSNPNFSVEFSNRANLLKSLLGF